MSSTNYLTAVDRELLKLIAAIENELWPEIGAADLQRFSEQIGELTSLVPHADHARLTRRGRDLAALLAAEPAFGADMRNVTTRDPEFVVPLAAAARDKRPIDGPAVGVWVGAQRPAMAPAAWAYAERELKDLVALRAAPVIPAVAGGPLRVAFRPLAASSQLESIVRLDLPAVTINPVPLQLKAVAEEAVRDLEPYARTLEGFERIEFAMRVARLPPALFSLWMRRPHGVELERRIRALHELPALTMQDLLSALLPETVNPDRRHILLLSELLQRFKLGFEPDPRFLAGLGHPDTSVSLIPWHHRSARPSGAFVTAAALMHIGLAMVAVDDSVDPREIAHVRDQALRLVSDDEERTRLNLRMTELVKNPPTFEPLLQRLKGVKPAAKEVIADLLVGVASSDGEVSHVEYEALQRAYRAMRLGKPALDRALEELRGHVRLANAIGSDGDRRSERGQEQDAQRFDALQELLLGTPAA